MRSGEWAQGLEYLAVHGLQEPDSVGTVLYEMATYLFWVELFDLPAGERIQEIIALLTTFVRTRHNGMVDRLNGGREHEVIRQVGQAVRAVAKNRYPACLEHFARIRQRRDEGRYAHLINLAPLIEGEEEDRADHTPWFSYSVAFSRDDSTTPEGIEATLAQVARTEKMRRRKGEYPFVRFARRLLNILWANKGHARINRGDLLTLSDSGDTHQLVDYRRLLVGAGILEPYRGSYRAGTAATLYRMTPMTMRDYEARYEAQGRSCAG